MRPKHVMQLLDLVLLRDVSKLLQEVLQVAAREDTGPSMVSVITINYMFNNVNEIGVIKLQLKLHPKRSLVPTKHLPTRCLTRGN